MSRMMKYKHPEYVPENYYFNLNAYPCKEKEWVIEPDRHYFGKLMSEDKKSIMRDGRLSIKMFYELVSDSRRDFQNSK